MARKIGEAFVRVRPDTKQMGSDVRREGEKHGKLFGSIFVRASAGPLRAVAGIVGASLAAVGAVGVLAKFGSLAKESVGLASDLNETLSKSSIIWGQNAKAIEKWGNSAATTLGLSKQQALESAASFGNFLKQLGVAPKATLDMSKGFLQLSADLASFNNVQGGTQEVSDAFAAALRGEYDSLQRVLPAINANAVQTEALRQTHKKSAKDLTDAEKAQALYTLALKGAGPAMGDFARTAGGAANQQRIMNAEIADAKARLGQGLLPIQAAFFKLVRTVGVPALDALGKFITKVTDAFDSGKVASGGFSGVVQRIGEVAKAAFTIFKTEVLPRLIEFGQYVKTEVLPRVGDLANNVQALLVPALKTAGDIIQNVVLPALEFIGKLLVEKVIPAISGLIGWLAKHKDVALALGIAILSTLVPAFVSWAIAAGVAAVNTILATAPILIMIGVVAALVYGIIQLAKHWDDIWGFIKTVAKAVGDWFAGPFVNFWKAAGDKIVGVAKAIWNWLKSNWPLLLGIIGGPIGLAVGLVIKYWGQIKGATTAAWNAVKGAIGSAVNWVKSTVSGGFKAAVDAVKGKFNEIVSLAKGLLGRIKSGIGNVKDKLYNIGKDLIQGMINGIKDMIGNLVGSIKDAIGAIPGTAKKILHLGSPSKLFRKFGRDTLAGYMLGVKDQSGAMDRTMADAIPVPSAAASGSQTGRTAGTSADTVSAFERALERVLARATLKIDDRTARFSDLLARGG